jgi:Big-like domain-containing protein
MSPSQGREGTRCVAAWLIVSATAIALTLALLVAPATALGGSYDVVACKGGADNSWAQSADPGMAAYDLCPNNPSSLISGIIARASVGSGAVGYLQGAYQVFTAPPGASLAQMTFDAAPYRWEQHWTVGVVAYDGNFNVGDLPWGCYAGQPGCGIVPGTFFGPITIGLGGHGQVRIEARCGNGGGCTIASSGQYPYTRATIAIANVSVRVQDFTPPGLNWTGGGLLSGGWLKGVQGVSFDAADNVGIRETRVRVDGGEVGLRGKTCDYSLRVPCPQGGDSYGLDTVTIRPDGTHTLTAEAVDTAGNVNQISRTILVDNTPPAQPENPTVVGGEGWRARNEFRINWQNPLHQTGSPLAGASYVLCRSGTSDCQGGTERLSGTESVDLRLPQAGEYVARLWLRDEAGNEDQKTAGPPVVLRLDDEAPELAFQQQDLSDPTRVSVQAVDRVSGIDRGEIELRKRNSVAWRPLDTTLEGGRLIAYLDDERLPDGSYELRARAVDRAGNERSTDRRADGQKAEVALPVRVATRLRVGVVKRSRRGDGRARRRARARLLARTRVGFGRRVRVTGQLTDGSGAPITDAQVLVSQALRAEGAAFSPLAAVRTSGSGRFSYLVVPGPSRTLRFRYPGASTVRPATREVSLLVPARTTLRVNQHFALNGETVTFSGRLKGRPLPASGKLVELQAHALGSWRTFATASAGEGGAWRYDYRFNGTRGRRVYRFRARVPREGTYPYEVGHSRGVRVTVVGL